MLTTERNGKESKSIITKNVPFIGPDFLFRRCSFTTTPSQEILLFYTGTETYEYYYWDLYFEYLAVWQAPFFAFLAWQVPHTYTLSAIFDYMACLVLTGNGLDPFLATAF